MNPKLHIALLLAIIFLYGLWFLIRIFRITKGVGYVTVADASHFERGNEIRVYSTIEPNEEGATKVQFFMVLKVDTKKNRLKVRETTSRVRAS